MVKHGEFSLLADVCREYLEVCCEDEEIPLYDQILRFVQKYKRSNTNNQLVLLTRFCKFVLRGARSNELDTALVEFGGILGNTKEELNFLKGWLRHLELDNVHDRSAEHFLDQRREVIRKPIVRRLADMMVEQEEGFGTKFWEVSLWKSPGSWCIATVLQDSLVRAGDEQYAKEFWSKMRRAWPKEPHLNYFYAESARNVADFKEATKGWLTWLEFIVSRESAFWSRAIQNLPLETTLQQLQTALAFEFELGYIIDVWEKLLENTTDQPGQEHYVSMLQKCMSHAFLAGHLPSSDQDTSFGLLVRVARLCPHDERIVSQLRVSEKLGDETQLWSSWLENGHHSLVSNWYTVRLAQVCSFNRRFADAEAWIDKLRKGYLDAAAVSKLANIDVGRDPRMFWSRKVEEPTTHDIAVRVLTKHCRSSPVAFWVLDDLARRRSWDSYLINTLQGLFRGPRPVGNIWHLDELEYWKGIVLSSPETPVVRALAEAFRFHKSPSTRPAVRKTLDDEIHLWYTIATQVKTEMEDGALLEHLNDALLEKADDAVDDELNQIIWVWIDARDKWTCLKNRAWHSFAADKIQKYLDKACAVLQVLQAGEQETRTAVAQLGNFLLSFFDLSVRGSTTS